jgi:hypothetical protein
MGMPSLGGRQAVRLHTREGREAGHRRLQVCGTRCLGCLLPSRTVPGLQGERRLPCARLILCRRIGFRPQVAQPDQISPEQKGMQVNDLSGILVSLITGNLLQLSLLLAAGVAYLRGRGTQRAYQGGWDFHIDWHLDFAERELFGQPVREPHSDGKVRLIITGGLSHSRYRGGFGVFQLRDGIDPYSIVVVEIVEVVLTPRQGFIQNLKRGQELREFRLHSVARQKMREFDYGPFANYHVVINYNDNHRLSGSLVVRKPRLPDEQVAELRATRT